MRRRKNHKDEKIENDGTILCDYGCGSLAKYIFPNGRYCCESDTSRCENLKTKIKKPLPKEKPEVCDYGCGKEPEYYFKSVDKWCCSKHFSKCENNKLKNPMKDPETITKNINTRIKNGTTGLGVPKSESFREKCRIRMKLNNPMKNHEIVIKSIKNHNKEKTGPEKYIEKVFNKLNLNIRYIGDGTLFINGKSPDFIIPNTKKLIEVYDSSFRYGNEIRDEKWIEKRRKQLYGHEVLFIDVLELGKARRYEKLVNIIKEFYFS